MKKNNNFPILLLVLAVLAVAPFLICNGCANKEVTDQQTRLIKTWEKIGDDSVKMTITEDKQVFFTDDGGKSFVFNLVRSNSKWNLQECDWPSHMELRIGIMEDEVCVASIDESDKAYADIVGRYTESPFEIDMDKLNLEGDIDVR